jgi:hypothetical protein
MERLSNAELIAEFERVCEQQEMWADEPGIMSRLKTLSAEISRRERCGQLIEDDWMVLRH